MVKHPHLRGGWINSQQDSFPNCCNFGQLPEGLVLPPHTHWTVWAATAPTRHRDVHASPVVQRLRNGNGVACNFCTGVEGNAIEAPSGAFGGISTNGVDDRSPRNSTDRDNLSSVLSKE